MAEQTTESGVGANPMFDGALPCGLKVSVCAGLPDNFVAITQGGRLVAIGPIDKLAYVPVGMDLSLPAQMWDDLCAQLTAPIQESATAAAPLVPGRLQGT